MHLGEYDNRYSAIVINLLVTLEINYDDVIKRYSGNNQLKPGADRWLGRAVNWLGGAIIWHGQENFAGLSQGQGNICMQNKSMRRVP